MFAHSYARQMGIILTMPIPVQTVQRMPVSEGERKSTTSKEKEDGRNQNTAGKMESNTLWAKQCNIVGVFVIRLLGVYCSVEH